MDSRVLPGYDGTRGSERTGRGASIPGRCLRSIRRALMIESLIEERKQARAAKNWARADEIRRILAEKKVILQDAGSTTTWKIE